MIDINLLPPSRSVKPGSGRRLFLTYLGAVAGLLLILAAVKFLYMDKALAGLEQNLADKRPEVTQARLQAESAQAEAAETVHLWRSASAIMELEERRRDQARLFGALDALMPHDKTWLLGAAHADGRLSLSGIAVDHDGVAALLSRLELGPFKNVRLVNSAQDTVINGVRLVSFSIEADSSLPEAALMEHGLPEAGLPSAAAFEAMAAKALPNFNFDADAPETRPLPDCE